MTPLLWRFSQRSLFRHPWLTALSIAGIGLGISVVVSIDLANEGARHAFQLSAEAVGGRATHSILGGPSGLPDELYRRIHVDLGFDAAAPVVEGYVRPIGRSQRPFHILGIDLFAEAPFRPQLSSARVELRSLLGQPGGVVLSAAAADELGVHPGDHFNVRIEGADRQTTLVGVLRSERAATGDALDDIMVADISTAQELLGKLGQIDRIDLILPSDPTEALAATRQLREIIPAGAEIAPASSRSQTLDQLTRAFRLNLTALSLLALLVGMFLIYNTVTFSVVRRRELIGSLRALGVTRKEVFTLVLIEALLLAIAGTTLGLVGGVALGRGLIHLVTRTINDLYFVVNVRALPLDPWTLLKGGILGIGATFVAALRPALEATRVSPVVVLQRSSIEATTRRRLPLFAGIGLGLLAVAVFLFWFPSRDLLVAFGGLAAVLFGFALIAPPATFLLAHLARPLMGTLGVFGRMAAGGVISSLSRTSVAVVALSIAVATSLGVGVMVLSFRGTVVRWLESSLIADVYVSAPGVVSRRGESTIEPELAQRVSAADGISEATTIRTARVRWQDRTIDLIAAKLSTRHQRPYRFTEGQADEIWRLFDASDAVVVSEPFAYHHRIRVSDSLELATDGGKRPFRVLAIYFDYGSDAGAVMMSRSTYERHFRDRGITGIGLFASAGKPAAELLAELRRLPGSEQLLIRSNRALREVSLEIFDRTFAITQVLRLLSIAVAFIGVLSALMALQLERSRELAVMRAIGLLPSELRKLVSFQTALLGLIAGLLALPLGSLLAYILVHVINKRSFGWTLNVILPPELMGQALLIAVGAALVAGIYPAWRMSRTPAALALKEP